MNEVKIEFVAHNAELVGFPTSALCSAITAAAKVCTAQDTNPDELDKHKEFVRKLLMRGHYSPFEFVDLTFYLTTSRAVANTGRRKDSTPDGHGNAYAVQDEFAGV